MKPEAQTLAGAAQRRPAGLHVPGWLDFLSGLHERHPRFWIRLGGWETRLLEDWLPPQAPDDPIYVTGLARSGSTILLELLARQPDLATHRYRDFPFLFTPWGWNWFLDRAARAPGEPEERAHGDGIAVTPESPEAFEEMLWMAFFPGVHDPGTSGVLDAYVSNPAFERFYRDHMRKLLALRGGRRYLAKANYNVTRLEYLLKLFPAARFVVPVRDPVPHVASLMRQHERFSREHARDGRLLDYMRRAGHFEFGLGRRPVNAGDREAVRRTLGLWAEGREAEGWAECWRAVYGHLAGRLEASPALRAAVLVVWHEDLCARPRAVMTRILDHCGLDAPRIVDLAQSILRPRGPASARLGEEERRRVRARTHDVAARLVRLCGAPQGLAQNV